MSASTFLQPALSDPIALPQTLQFEAGSIVGLIDRSGQLSGLIASLTNLGIARERIQITRAYSPVPGQPGMLGRIAARLNVIGPERELARHYNAALASGAAIVTVRSLSNGKHDIVARALKTAGGHYIHSFGRFTVRTLAA